MGKLYRSSSEIQKLKTTGKSVAPVLGVFVKLRKTTVSLVIPVATFVRLSVRPPRVLLPLGGIS